jgi:hypothetical protein
MMKESGQRKQIKIKFTKDFISTLSDPAWAATFANAKVSGLAAESFTRAILSKYDIKLGKVVNVTPQKYENLPGFKGTRVDIEVETDDNELILIEIQIRYDKSLPQRNWLTTAHIISDSIPAGTETRDYAHRMPKIIVINICCHNIRDDRENGDIIQAVQLRYGAPPHEVADDQYCDIFIQLPQFLTKLESTGGEPDWNDDFESWLYVIWKSHELGITPREVVAMHTQLQELANRDVGFEQYCVRYNRVASDNKARREYAMWLDETIRQQSIVDSAVEDAVIPLLEQLGALEQERGKLHSVVADKDAKLAERDTKLAERDAKLAEREAEIARLKALLGRDK